MTMSPRAAIILHGPPCSGKTQIGRELEGRFSSGSARLISLDEGWAMGARRRQESPGRYADLRDAREPIVVIELGCGEPPDLTFPGATREADAWIRILRDSGRELHGFLLSLPPADVLFRLKERHRGDPNLLFIVWQFFGLYALYEHKDPIATFPQIADFSEQTINTSNRSVADVVDEILSRSGLA